MSCGVQGVLAAGARAVEAALDGEAGVLGGWVDAPVLPPLLDGRRALRLVYAYPAIRLSTLRHWRDEVELEVDGVHVVAMEASKWARLLLKQHAPTLDVVQLAPASGSAPEVGALQRLGMALLAGDVGPAERFDRIEAWLVQVRRACSDIARSAP